MEKLNDAEVEKIINILQKSYPDAKCSLDFETPFQLLVAVCLSAQCTDERVNKTTPTLFKKYSTPEDFAKADVKDVEKIIKSCGFYRNKAKNLVNAGKVIVEKFNGEVPKDMEKLQEIPGVGRKSANVIMCEAFNDTEGIAVDTHCKRLANRIGLSDKDEPTKIEQDLLKEIPKKYWKGVNHLLIYHGREVCTARNPKCEECKLKDLCNFYEKKGREKIGGFARRK